MQQLLRFLRDIGRTRGNRNGPVVIQKSQLYDCCGGTTPFKAVLKELATTAVRDAFNVNTESCKFNIDATLEKMVICAENELYSDTFNDEKEPGIFKFVDKCFI